MLFKFSLKNTLKSRKYMTLNIIWNCNLKPLTKILQCYVYNVHMTHICKINYITTFSTISLCIKLFMNKFFVSCRSSCIATPLSISIVSLFTVHVCKSFDSKWLFHGSCFINQCILIFICVLQDVSLYYTIQKQIMID